MLYTALVAALAFQAPASLTRRDMMVNAASFGAAFAAAPAFADASKYAGSADRKKAEKAAADLAAAGGPKPTQYEVIMKTARPAEEKAKKDQEMALNYDGISTNGKTAGGVTYRKPSDPNACSEVRARPRTRACASLCDVRRRR